LEVLNAGRHYLEALFLVQCHLEYPPCRIFTFFIAWLPFSTSHAQCFISLVVIISPELFLSPLCLLEFSYFACILLPAAHAKVCPLPFFASRPQLEG